MKKNAFKVQIIQSSLIWEDIEAHLLPEMFSTGFSMNPDKTADENEKVLNWMKSMSALHQKALCGSVVVRDSGHHYNRLYFVQPNGEYQQYDKRHLFTMGDEPNHYTAGKHRIVIDYMGWKILPLVCYDLRFPVYSRNDIGYDVLLYVANWPEKRAHHWKALLLARAIENQCYVAACNRVGEDGNGVGHSGDSTIINFRGDTLSSLSETAGILEAELDYDKLLEARSKFPVLPDADSFSADWKP